MPVTRLTFLGFLFYANSQNDVKPRKAEEAKMLLKK